MWAFYMAASVMAERQARLEALDRAIEEMRRPARRLDVVWTGGA